MEKRKSSRGKNDTRKQGQATEGGTEMMTSEKRLEASEGKDAAIRKQSLQDGTNQCKDPEGGPWSRLVLSEDNGKEANAARGKSTRGQQ